MLSLYLLGLFLLQSTNVVYSLYERGYIDYQFEKLSIKSGEKNTTFQKSMSANSEIRFTIDCRSKNLKVFKVEVLLTFNPCHKTDTSRYLVYHVNNSVPCQHHILMKVPIELEQDEAAETEMKDASINKTPTPLNPTQPAKSHRKRRDENSSKAATDKPNPNNKHSIQKQTSKSEKLVTTMPKTTIKTHIVNKEPGTDIGVNVLYKTNMTGMYKVIFKFTALDDEEIDISGRIESTLKSGSYLSAITYPLLPFYGVMSLVYLMYGIIWFCCSCCNWKDILRVQFWIGGVIALGMFENAVYYSEYQSISSHGRAFDLLYFAEIVSSAKRALARVLVIIVSIGFGIVRPRLGQTLHKVVVVGGLFFVLASIEGCLRVHDGIKIQETKQLFALVPLTVVDVSICWWIFTSLVQTTRTLRIRKNLVKLALYRHFTNILIFSVLVSLAYMVYTVKENKYSACINISMFWLQEALWPFLFALILAVIMFLWRPSANNQRYAFTPLDMGEEGEDDDMTLSDAFEGMKMRNKSETTAKNRKSAEDDLRWVEENIPSVPSTLLPTIDSDEEILTTKFEVSKMN